MLKKIPVDQVRMGMHLHALEGAWLEHPFWKTRFVIADPADLRKLRDSGVREVWIDPGKGRDVALADERPGLRIEPAQAVAPTPTGAAPAMRSAPAAPAASHTVADELHAARDICRRSNAAVATMFQEARLGRVVDAEGCVPLVEEIARSVQRNPAALISLARLKTQDDYTYMHSVAVCALMVALGRETGMDEAACRVAGLAGLLHDLGKAAMPVDVLNKPGKLTEAEFAVMRQHPERGHEMLVEGRGAGEDVLDVCLHHHERVDGAGYPHRLAGDAISRIARMGAICDVYDAVTSNRPYKKGWDPAESIARMASWRGHLDPTLFAHFVRSLGIYPIGSLVRLASGRLAVVVEQNPGQLTAPCVKTFFSIHSNMPIPAHRIDLRRGNERIVARESPTSWGFTHLESLWSEARR